MEHTTKLIAILEQTRNFITTLTVHNDKLYASLTFHSIISKLGVPREILLETIYYIKDNIHLLSDTDLLQNANALFVNKYITPAVERLKMCAHESLPYPVLAILAQNYGKLTVQDNSKLNMPQNCKANMFHDTMTPFLMKYGNRAKFGSYLLLSSGLSSLRIPISDAREFETYLLPNLSLWSSTLIATKGQFNLFQHSFDHYGYPHYHVLNTPDEQVMAYANNVLRTWKSVAQVVSDTNRSSERINYGLRLVSGEVHDAAKQSVYALHTITLFPCPYSITQLSSLTLSDVIKYALAFSPPIRVTPSLKFIYYTTQQLNLELETNAVEMSRIKVVTTVPPYVPVVKYPSPICLISTISTGTPVDPEQYLDMFSYSPISYAYSWSDMQAFSLPTVSRPLKSLNSSVPMPSKMVNLSTYLADTSYTEHVRVDPLRTIVDQYLASDEDQILKAFRHYLTWTDFNPCLTLVKDEDDISAYAINISDGTTLRKNVSTVAITSYFTYRRILESLLPFEHLPKDVQVVLVNTPNLHNLLSLVKSPKLHPRSIASDQSSYGQVMSESEIIFNANSASCLVWTITHNSTSNAYDALVETIRLKSFISEYCQFNFIKMYPDEVLEILKIIGLQLETLGISSDVSLHPVQTSEGYGIACVIQNDESGDTVLPESQQLGMLNVINEFELNQQVVDLIHYYLEPSEHIDFSYLSKKYDVFDIGLGANITASVEFEDLSDASGVCLALARYLYVRQEIIGQHALYHLEATVDYNALSVYFRRKCVYSSSDAITHDYSTEPSTPQVITSSQQRSMSAERLLSQGHHLMFETILHQEGLTSLPLIDLGAGRLEGLHLTSSDYFGYDKIGFDYDNIPGVTYVTQDLDFTTLPDLHDSNVLIFNSLFFNYTDPSENMEDNFSQALASLLKDSPKNKADRKRLLMFNIPIGTADDVNKIPGDRLFVHPDNQQVYLTLASYSPVRVFPPSVLDIMDAMLFNYDWSLLNLSIYDLYGMRDVFGTTIPTDVYLEALQLQNSVQSICIKF